MSRHALIFILMACCCGMAGCSTCRTTHDYDGPVYCDDGCGHCGECGDSLARYGSILSGGGYGYDEPMPMPAGPEIFDGGPILDDYRPEDFPPEDTELMPGGSELPTAAVSHGRVVRAQYKAPMKLRR